MSRPLAVLPRLVLLELSELTLSGPRARFALAAALAVGIAIFLALMLRLQAVYWAGISAFVCIQASQPQSVQKGLHRISGTVLGAALALALFPPVAFNQTATLMLLFCAGSFAILGSLVSRYSYAWLLGGITMLMVILGALNDPTQTLNLAFNRSCEIVIGTSAALVMAKLFLPATARPAPPALGWASLVSGHDYMIGHAVRTGIAVALVPVVWRVFELPDLSQMAISIGAVMAVPVLTGRAEEDRRAVVERSVQRLLGCLIGGGAGLLLLLTPLAAMFWIWLAALMLGAAIAAQIETGRHGIQTIAIQAEVGLIVTLVQGWGPAVDLAPALDRVAGMIGAILLLLAVNFAFGPGPAVDVRRQA
jgi:uncharacterized membrane protein YccC